MESILKAINRDIEYNGEIINVDNFVDNVDECEVVKVFIRANNTVQYIEEEVEEQDMGIIEVGKTYRIKVRQYMTKPATPEFDFQDKWNKGIPMPFRTMTAVIKKETKGMYFVECWVEPMETSSCMKCGRRLNHPVSKLYGIGPECGQHAHINPFETSEELHQHLEEIKVTLNNIKWEGWIIKTAIEEYKEVK